MTTAKILVSDTLSDAGLAILKNAGFLETDYKPGLTEAQLCESIAPYDGLVIRSGSKITANVLERATKLKVIGRAGIGVDNVDVPAASRRGIVVMNTPTGNAITTAEHAIALLLSLARKIPAATASMRGGKWEKNKFQGSEVTGKTLGVVGLGNIGRIVADRGRGLRMRVIGFDPVLTKERAEELGVTLVSIDQLFREADFITVHTPLTADTKGLIGKTSIPKMKKGVLIINAARGGIVDEAALIEALDAGHVGGAALDVFPKEPPDPADPVLKHEKLVLTPHLGASTAEAQERVALEIAEQVVAFFRDGTVTNAVNVPAMAPGIADRLGPYLQVAQRLGALLSQLERVDLVEFRVTCSGDPSELGSRAVSHYALAGYLARYLDLPVNAISAPPHAEERGIRVAEVREATRSRHPHLVKVEAIGKTSSHVAAGTVMLDGSPRLVHLDGYDIDAHLEGKTIVLRNDDRPGVIGAVGTVLGRRSINVSRMQVGLDEKTRQAVALWCVDSKVPEDVLAELRALPSVSSVLSVEL